MAESRPKSVFAHVLLGAVLAVPLRADQFGPTPVYSTTVRGDYVVGQNATRVSSGSQTDDFPVQLEWSGVIVRAIANWSYLTWSPSGDTGEATITVNGSTVVGSLSALTEHDCAWGFNHVASYSADITELVAAHGPGVFTIGSAIDEPPPSSSFGEGFTIVAVYDNGSALRHVHIYLGGINSSDFSPGTGLGRMGLAPPYPGGPLNFFVNAIDGQSTLNEDFYVNSTILSGIITGGTLGDAFPGAEGPVGNPGDVRYDRAQGDISSWVPAGMVEITFQSAWSSLGHDAVGHTIGAISYPALCVGDLNRDNGVGIDDLSVILAHFGQPQGTYEDGDLNDDGRVSISDLANLLAIFGTLCD